MREYAGKTALCTSRATVSLKKIMSDPINSTTGIPKQYDPSTAEEKWYAFWEENGYFHSEPDDREPYTIVIPPPNVTGVLHMGHMLNNTIQDVLVRRARMQGKNACWVPGTDHASIATEAKVVQKLRKQGIKKSDLSREEFLEHAWEWTEEHGGIILQQLKKLGASCDWKRTRFTLEDDLYDAVIDCFIDLYERGYIYRGLRMINWDPSARTALSDEEVIHKEVQSKLYHVKYKIKGSDEFVTIATTRPETILADTGVCVNPKDKRYRDLIGKTAIIPMVEREVPVIADDYVDPEYGTGCLKETPAHDVNDYEIGQRHGLDVIDMFNDDGTVGEKGEFYVGQDRFEARKSMIRDLEKNGCLIKVEEIANKIGYSERTAAVIEPRLSLQWFCSMKELAKPALENVMNDEIRFHPDKFKNTYRHWMENIRDWCISRQLWWGQRIPAWYYGKGENEYVIARTEEEAVEKARQKSGNDKLNNTHLTQDEDVLDTWFSSWLWPITVFDGFKDPGNREINYYYPTQDLVTAPEIMFFWVARMIMASYAFRGEKPFNNVYYHGIVRDDKRRKMSKSLGNSPDPLRLISDFGADGTRVGTDVAEARRVVSPEAARQTTEMMEQVLVPDVGVAPGAQVEGYRVAGKTGTAQRVNPECGCYDGSFSVSFAGFAPADDPRFTIYVVVHEPRGGGGGSVTGPAFSKLMSYTLRRFGVPPTGSPTPTLEAEW
jgi:valyl-tRNA synthetase